MAHQQIKDILEVSRSWSQEVVQNEAAIVVRNSEDNTDYFKASDQLPEAVNMEGERRYLKVMSPPWLIVPPKQEKDCDVIPAMGTRNGRFFVGQPSTLMDFQCIWNWLSHVSIQPVSGLTHFVIFIKAPEEASLTESTEATMRDWDGIQKYPQGQFERTLELTLSPLSPTEVTVINRSAVAKYGDVVAQEGGIKDRYAWKGVLDIYEGYYAFLAHSVLLPRAENLQDALIRRFQDRWRRGSFSDVFRELDSIALEYKDLQLDRIERILQHEEDRRRDPFEAFGVKFPPDKTARWGVLLILGIQMYFFIHLAEYRRLHIRDNSVAWIGSYRQTFARIIFTASSFVLPVGVVLFVALRGHLFQIPRSNWIAGTIAVGISILLALLGGRAVLANRRYARTID